MSESRPEPTVDLGIYGRATTSDGMDITTKIALIASLAWLVAVVFFLAFVGFGDATALVSLRFLVTVLITITPIGLIWVGTI